MSQERFYALMHQYIADQLDPHGRAELQELLRTGDHDNDLKKIYDEVYERPDQEFDLSPDRVRKVLYAIHNNEAAKVIPFYKRQRKTWWAAAAVLILAVGSLTIKLLMKNPAPVALTIPRPALPIHTDKAVLTLANGQQVILDNTASGSIAELNGVSIIKTDSGQLSYIAKGAGVAGGYNVLSTPRGGQYVVQLPDGSKVWLNSASSLRYPTVFSGNTRDVELQGEAYFEVAKNSRQPFTVQAGQLKVAVLGTAFNLMAYTEEEAIKTTLVNGSVSLQKDHNAQVIRPGEQGSLDRGGDHFIISRPDLEDVLAWKNGEFRFSGEKIQVIMRQLARWYDVDVEYQGEPPVNNYNGDIIKGKNGNALLDILEGTKTVHFKIEGKKIIVIAGPAVTV